MKKLFTNQPNSGLTDKEILEVRQNTININDIVYYKTPINFKNWGTVKLIFVVKDSINEEEKNKIIYRVVPLIKDGNTYYDDIEISDIYEVYSKKI